MEKIIKKELEKLTEEDAFFYAEKLNFKNVPKTITYKISLNGKYAYWYAKKLH